MSQSNTLEQEFTAFARLEVAAPERKATIRDLQGRVQRGQFALSRHESIDFRSRDDELARIFCYLVEQFANTPFDRRLLREGVDVELVRRRRDGWSATKSNQPLYYAIRAHVERCLEDPRRFAEARGDASLFKEVLADLDKEPRYTDEKDIRGQIARFLDNVEQLERKTASDAANGAAAAAAITAEASKWSAVLTSNTAKVTATIAAVGTVVVAMINLVPRGPTAAVTPAASQPTTLQEKKPQAGTISQAARPVQTQSSAASTP